MVILTEMNRNHNYLLNNRECINLVNKYRNFIFNDYYYSEFKKFKDYYIIYCYPKNKLFTITYYNYSVKMHREDGPAWISYYKNGEISDKGYLLNGKKYSYKNYLLEIKKLA